MRGRKHRDDDDDREHAQSDERMQRIDAELEQGARRLNVTRSLLRGHRPRNDYALSAWRRIVEAERRQVTENHISDIIELGVIGDIAAHQQRHEEPPP